jgi:hypothetical protein
MRWPAELITITSSFHAVDDHVAGSVHSRRRPDEAAKRCGAPARSQHEHGEAGTSGVHHGHLWLTASIATADRVAKPPSSVRSGAAFPDRRASVRGDAATALVGHENFVVPQNRGHSPGVAEARRSAGKGPKGHDVTGRGPAKTRTALAEGSATRSSSCTMSMSTPRGATSPVGRPVDRPERRGVAARRLREDEDPRAVRHRDLAMHRVHGGAKRVRQPRGRPRTVRTGAASPLAVREYTVIEEPEKFGTTMFLALSVRLLREKTALHAHDDEDEDPRSDKSLRPMSDFHR